MKNEALEQRITRETIIELLNSSTSEFAELQECYSLLPATQCARKAHCCKMLPETTFLEALAALKRLQRETPEMRRYVFRKIVSYFFINPAQITSCPFLEENRCLIYEDRFFGCRAYGLWSLQHYEKIANQSRQAKKWLGEMWLKLGIRLPEKIIDFNLPYCLEVITADKSEMDDTALIRISEMIHSLSNRMVSWHETFNKMYFGDLSFLITSLVFDISPALQMKVDIVRGKISKGEQSLLDEALQKVPDVLPFRMDTN